jgi:REP element-mobilizing transposase RayT
MARKPRIHFPGALYHVILRGNAGQPVFIDDADRCRYYMLMQEVTEKFGCRVHAFCCMTNHIHIALQVGTISLSRIMQNLTLRYTNWINKKYRRTGHVFQGRFKAILIDADSYLLELVRYIHLNPVRAGIVTNPADYPWIGHQCYLGKQELPWLTSEWVLSHFSSEISLARKSYDEFVLAGMDECRRQEFHSGTVEGRILGDDGFADQVLQKAEQQRHQPKSLEEIMDAVCQKFSITIAELAATGKTRPNSEVRALVALLIRESSDYSLTELSKILNRDVASLSQAARRLAEKIRLNPDLARVATDLKARLDIV